MRKTFWRHILVAVVISLATPSGGAGAAAQVSGTSNLAPAAAAPVFNVSSYTTGAGPYSVATEDLDGDGDIDLAVANRAGDTVSVLINNGNGTFAAKVDYATGDAPGSVAIADLDGDGHLDLAVANDMTNTVSVLLNNGDGTFAAKIDYPIGSSHSNLRVAMADLDGDTDVDLAVSNGASHTVSVLLNNGDGTFAAKVDYAAGSWPGGVATADLDGDGKVDLAVTNGGSHTVSVLLNNGNGTFAAKVDYAAGTSPVSVAVADLSGDEKLDLAVTNEGSGTVSVLVNSGNGTFVAKVDYATGSNPVSVAVADLDGDGHRDLAVANFLSHTVSVLLNIGDGTFAAKVDYAAGGYPDSVVIADLNGDGPPDLAIANQAANTVTVMIQANHPPTAPVVDVTPNTPHTSDNLTALITTPSADPDGDPVTYSYAWYKNNALQSGLTANAVPASATSKGEVWKCVVTPNDGKQNGPSGQDQVTIANSPPTAPAVDVIPDSPGDTDKLAAGLATASIDADGDVVSYIFQWYKNSVLQPYITTNFVPESLTAPGEVWEAVVTPTDGTLSGPSSEDEVTIASDPVITIHVSPGWNMVGLPANQSVSWGTVQVRYGNDTCRDRRQPNMGEQIHFLV